MGNDPCKHVRSESNTELAGCIKFGQNLSKHNFAGDIEGSSCNYCNTMLFAYFCWVAKQSTNGYLGLLLGYTLRIPNHQPKPTINH